MADTRAADYSRVQRAVRLFDEHERYRRMARDLDLALDAEIGFMTSEEFTEYVRRVNEVRKRYDNA